VYLADWAVLTRTFTPSFAGFVDAYFIGGLTRVIGGSVLGGLIFFHLSATGLNLFIYRRPTLAALLPRVQVDKINQHQQHCLLFKHKHRTRSTSTSTIDIPSISPLDVLA
jgi:hypothetical protein